MGSVCLKSPWIWDVTESMPGYSLSDSCALLGPSMHSMQGNSHRMQVRVLPEGSVPRPPAALREGACYHALWAAKPWDTAWLSMRALRLCATVLPAASEHSSAAGGALELSYWLAANLPLGVDSRLIGGMGTGPLWISTVFFRLTL